MSFCRFACLAPPLLVILALATAGCAAPPLVVGASYAADGGLLAASNKTSTDHLMSMVSKQDCAIWRVIRSRPICTEREDGHDPYEVDYAQPQRMVGEDGVHYVAPLRSGPGVPSTSWEAAAYASAPPAGPAAPQAALPAALADPAPMAPPAAKPTPSAAPATAKAAMAAPPPKPVPAAKPAPLAKKAKAKPIRKPSQGQAVSGS